MDFKKLADEAKKFVDEHGGTEVLKEEAMEVKDIVQGGGSNADKAKQVANEVKDYMGNKTGGTQQ